MMNSPLWRTPCPTRITGVAALLLAGLVGVGVGSEAWAQSTSATANAPDASRRGELIALVRQDCGSCHGLTLNGGLGPALLPETLRDKPKDSLTATIMQGRPGTAMPPWRRFVSEAEAEWIVVNLQKGFPSGR